MSETVSTNGFAILHAGTGIKTKLYWPLAYLLRSFTRRLRTPPNSPTRRGKPERISLALNSVSARNTGMRKWNQKQLRSM